MTEILVLTKPKTILVISFKYTFDHNLMRLKIFGNYILIIYFLYNIQVNFKGI